ncbi:putative SNARE protein (Ufe1) [Aspergillus ruber CBS 135680]|uniref:Snare protein n=1 Tax=Aspergillus ruber (strain CBS 135680) TaxID=1388766 RepID=A0A017SH64_ASPRC|nr:snare protein [Aspergillus ruber CBS 135680]EYE95620.1 snare protein [Aspergillus ruber CBS 135680]
MTDLTPTINTLLTERNSSKTIPQSTSRPPSLETADEFLKEAYRINSHIASLLRYLQSIRHSYLTTTSAPPPSQRQQLRRTSSVSKHSQSQLQQNGQEKQAQGTLTDPQRDEIDTSTSLLLRDLSSSITNLSSAESLRQETESTLLRKKYGSTNILFRWASGGDKNEEDKSVEQRREEEVVRYVRVVREGVLWFLRRGLEDVVVVQRGMVERRIERVREREKSVLYKAAVGGAGTGTPVKAQTRGEGAIGEFGGGVALDTHDSAAISENEVAAIEAELSPEQLQLFAEENDTMLRYYEDTLDKVQNAEKSLLEIASLQQTLVGHLATQEDYIGQLITDASNTTTNIGEGNKELKRATEQRSTAQAVFWGTVGLCTWLVVWDLIF